MRKNVLFSVVYPRLRFSLYRDHLSFQGALLVKADFRWGMRCVKAAFEAPTIMENLERSWNLQMPFFQAWKKCWNFYELTKSFWKSHKI